MAILGNDGTGNFTEILSRHPGGDRPGDVVVAHFNNDNHWDLAVSNFGDLDQDGNDQGDGPRSTPIVDGPTVYALFADRGAAERAVERLMEPESESLPDGARALAALRRRHHRAST